MPSFTKIRHCPHSASDTHKRDRNLITKAYSNCKPQTSFWQSVKEDPFIPFDIEALLQQALLVDALVETS